VYQQEALLLAAMSMVQEMGCLRG